MTNRKALTETLARLGDLEGLEAEIQAAFTIADELDAGNAVPEMLREYRFAVRVIREATGSDDSANAEIVDLFERLGGTAIRNAAN